MSAPSDGNNSFLGMHFRPDSPKGNWGCKIYFSESFSWVMLVSHTRIQVHVGKIRDYKNKIWYFDENEWTD